MKEITNKRRGTSLVLTVFAVAMLAGPAYAAKGGKKGGGGSTDACSTTESFFPAVVHAVTSSRSKNRMRTVVLSSADGSCEKALYSFPVQYGLSWDRMQLHVDFNPGGSVSSGFVVWVDSASVDAILTLKIQVLDFTVGEGNTVEADISGPRTLLATDWDSGSNTGRRLLAGPRLSPDGNRLLVSAYVTTIDGGFNQVWQCEPGAADCDPEVLLEIPDEDTYSDSWEVLWQVAPSAAADRFFVILIPEYNGSFNIHTVDQDIDGAWQVAASPFFQSTDFIGHLDAHPYDADRLAWGGGGVVACKINNAGVCDVDDPGSWTISDAAVPSWSRRGLLADASQSSASLYYRDYSTATGSTIVIRERYGEAGPTPESSETSFSILDGFDAY